MKPTVLILFGITGDLARHKILPALYHLMRQELLGKIQIIGISRQTVENQRIIADLAQVLTSENNDIDRDILGRLDKSLTMLQMDPQQADDYTNLTKLTAQYEGSQVFAYLSLPPQVFNRVITNLATKGYHQASLLIEKPFGYDLASARELTEHTAKYFPESQLFRIDHYLAKEMAAHMIDYRRNTPVLHDLWNGQHVCSIAVRSTESIGIAGRANFYDNIGALRDVIQSHLLQLLAVTMMQLPSEVNADSIHAARHEVLSQLQWTGSARRGQYVGYRDEVANETSATETYAELTLQSGDPRWSGTNISVSTGKAMANKDTSVTVVFDNNNFIRFNIQPNEGIIAQVEGTSFDLASSLTTSINFPTTLAAYERVLLDALNDDHTTFATDVEVLESWRIVQPVLDSWKHDTAGLTGYQPGASEV